MTFSDKLRGRWPELWQLALVTETLATHLDVSIGTVGVRIGSSSNLAKRLESGRVQYSTAASLLGRLSDMWPEELQWPEDVSRPVPSSHTPPPNPVDTAFGES